MQSISVPEAEAGRRLDKYLMKYLDAAPKSFIYKAFRKKNIKLCGKRADGSEIISGGDIIELYFSDETLATLKSAAKHGDSRKTSDPAAHPEQYSEGRDGKAGSTAYSERESGSKAGKGRRSDDRAAAIRVVKGDKRSLAKYCSIVYEDEHVIFADKRAGVLSQKSERRDYSLNEALLDYCGGGESDVFVPSVCNRIDRNTTGLVCFARTYTSARELSRIIRDREVRKYYTAVVRGRFTGEEHINAYLIKDERSNTVRVSRGPKPGAERIETAFRPVDAYESRLLGLKDAYGTVCGADYTVLKVELITGKSHQIRAQLASMGYPILGDIKYGDSELNRRLKSECGIRYQLLNAWEMHMPDKLNAPLDSMAGKTFRTGTPESLKKLV